MPSTNQRERESERERERKERERRERESESGRRAKKTFPQKQQPKSKLENKKMLPPVTIIIEVHILVTLI